MVWWSKDGTEIWNSLENFTYNPVVPEPPKVKQKRKIGLYLWKYKATDEYAAHQYVPEEDGLTDEDVEVIDEFEHEVEE